MKKKTAKKPTGDILYSYNIVTFSHNGFVDLKKLSKNVLLNFGKSVL
jgi:hypothetical protein